MNISLPPEWEQFIADEVKSGVFETPAQVVSAGLRRLKEDQEVSLPQVPATLEELEAMLKDRLNDSSKSIDGRESYRRLRQRIDAATPNG